MPGVTTEVSDYSESVRTLFRSLAHAGVIAGPRIEMSRGGMHIELSAAITGRRLTALRFRAFACPHLMAAAETFCEEFEGRMIEDLRQYSASQAIARLGIPLEKTGRILLLEDAIMALGDTLPGLPDTAN
jgi:NifU-like protein involved in Fe-S cluster formation